MKIIFLDFDGVMVTNWSNGSGNRAKANPACVRELNRITDATGAFIVISSTWRLGTPIVELREILASWGVTGKVLGKTPTISVNQGGIAIWTTREKEIKAWMDMWVESRDAPESFVILDDDLYVGHPRHHVKTKFSEGLTEECAEKAIEILSGAP